MSDRVIQMNHYQTNHATSRVSSFEIYWPASTDDDSYFLTQAKVNLNHTIRSNYNASICRFWLKAQFFIFCNRDLWGIKVQGTHIRKLKKIHCRHFKCTYQYCTLLRPKLQVHGETFYINFYYSIFQFREKRITLRIFVCKNTKLYNNYMKL